MEFDSKDPTGWKASPIEVGVSLSQQAFNSGRQEHELRDVSIAAGSGFFAGSALTAAGQYGAMKIVEPIARPGVALVLGAMGARQMASRVLNARAMTFAECVAPKPVFAGGIIAASLLAGGYEFYKHVYQNDA